MATMSLDADTGEVDESANGSELLGDVRDAIRTYCVLPGEHQLVAVVLWCALSHLLAKFEYAPRLVIRSAEKGSGKSRLLEVVDALVYSPLRAVNATVAFVFRSLDTDPPPTLLFDEADTIFGSKAVSDKNEELRGLLNAGFQRDLPFGRVVGSDLKPQEFATFAMAALAGIGRMPETIEDRAVVVVMKRRRNDEIVKPYRKRCDKPGLDDLHDRLAMWADSVRDRAGETYPELPVEDRAADVWEPLIAVADLAGGDWPGLARAAAVALVKSSSEDDAERSPKLQLLTDIRDVFNTSFMKSHDLCEKLRELPESPWGQLELSPTALGKRLKEYGVKPRHTADKAERGYYLVDFADPFVRYLPSQQPSEGVHAVPQLVNLNESRDIYLEPVQALDSVATVEAEPTNHPSSWSTPDALDTVGHLPGNRQAGPSPATMSKRCAGTIAAPTHPERKRARVRGRHSSRPRR